MLHRTTTYEMHFKLNRISALCNCMSTVGRFPGITKMISGVICSGSTAVLITEWYIFIIRDSGNTKSILAGSVKQGKKL